MAGHFSQACENNKAPILAGIKAYLRNARTVLEVGSGTAQHAIHFAQNLPDLQWQTSDQLAYHEGIAENLLMAGLDNILSPIELDVRTYPWGAQTYDAIFSANTLHIMSETSAIHFVHNVALSLTLGGVFMVYGPFNYAGKYTSESNARFDDWLKAQNPQSSIRDFEMIEEAVLRRGLKLEQDHAMPANNRLLVFSKVAA